MRTVDEIEKAISNLPPEDLAQFRHWFDAFDAAQWDRQLERDAAAGALDRLAGQAIQDFKEGRCKEL